MLKIFLTGVTDTEPLALLWLVTWLIENKALSENVFAGSRAETIQNERDFIELQICRVNIFDRRAGESI